jgi:aryl-alcohol dehydrogenase-like predicted oxidoreductase
VPSLLQIGTSNFGPTSLYTHHTKVSQQAILDTFHSHDLRRIDTARVYGITDEYGPGGSERVLASLGVTGEEGVKKGWVVDTKVSTRRAQSGPSRHNDR